MEELKQLDIPRALVRGGMVFMTSDDYNTLISAINGLTVAVNALMKQGAELESNILELQAREAADYAENSGKLSTIASSLSLVLEGE
ncbi:hypothetical protein [Paratractidigestivibacter sp.]|uniref:hypothetical protein n=1 Tax=Paratractidigestivibacter sp. TaxID=2847316 RepID=UPI002AC91C2B|nr:hypothetical protein [Paratractidigestivibacter sp.]